MSYSDESGIYQLTDFQANNLTIAANSPAITFAVIEPTEDDAPETQEKLRRWLQETDDLVKLDLVEDVSEQFAEQIGKLQGRDGRQYHVFMVTEVGFLMFHNFGERVAN